MLRFLNQINDTKVLSLRNGREIATLQDIIIDPDKLHLTAFYVDDPRSNEEKVLFSDDVREYAPRGIIVDSNENLMDLEGLVRLEKLIAINFRLEGKRVVTNNKRKVGKVINAVFDDRTYLIEKLYVRPSLLKAFSSNDLIIGRKQIVEVTDQEIIVKDVDIKSLSSSKIGIPTALSSQAQP